MTATEAMASPAGPMVPQRHRVIGRQAELRDTITLALEPIDGPTRRYGPGQFNMLYVFGVGEVPISMSSDPTGSGPLLHTIRSVGAVTAALCAVESGDVVGVRGPYGHGWDLSGARGRDVVLVAGGIGLAPLRPALYAVLADRDAFGRVVLVVGARTPGSLLFRSELEEWRGRLDLDVLVTVDRAEAGWHGDVGVVTTLLGRLPIDAAHASAFLCGPEVMMRFAGLALLDAGLAADRVHVSLERNMKCAVAQCGHCQIGPTFVCREGPVYRWSDATALLEVRER